MSAIMFVFRRRHIQAMLDRLYAVMPRKQVDALVDKLNRPNVQRLPTMWEAAFLDAFAQQGAFVHESLLPNGRRPDLGGLRWRDGGREHHLIGDILTISDQGRHEANPFQWLLDQIQQRALRRGLAPRRFRLSVSGSYVQKEPPRRRRNSIFREPDATATLTLGSKQALTAILDTQVEAFVATVRASPEQDHTLDVAEADARFTVSYRPAQNFSGGGHLSYTVAASLRQNPLANALERKADQLKAAPADATRLVVACDGGCALFHSWMRNSGHPSTYSAVDIATEFLNASSTVDMVLLIGVEERAFPLAVGRHRRLRATLVVAQEGCRSPRATLDAIHAVDRMLRNVMVALPAEIAQDPANAARRCLKAGCGPDDIGAWEWSNKGLEMTVKVSARGLQRLLAGEITPEQFATLHRWDQPKGMANPFRFASMRGQMITAARIERQDDRDDDMIALTLTVDDPANGPFLKRDPAAREPAGALSEKDD